MKEEEKEERKPKPIGASKKTDQASNLRSRPERKRSPRFERPKAQEIIGEHTVVSGETLTHISLKFYGSAAKTKYMLIYEANKDVIGDDPNVIVTGQVLKIPKLEE